MNQPDNTDRRNFLNTLLGGAMVAWLASVLYPLFAFLRPPETGEVEESSVKAGKTSDLIPDSGKIVKFGNKPALLIKTSDGKLKAFTGTCTHLDCTVQYRQDMGQIWCACHNGRYDLNGRNVAGPPPRPLTEFKVIVQGEDVFISKES